MFFIYMEDLHLVLTALNLSTLEKKMKKWCHLPHNLSFELGLTGLGFGLGV